MRVAVLGTFCMDTVHDPDGSIAFRSPGGVLHSLGALRRLCPSGWEILPLARVGGELWPVLREALGGDPRIRWEGLESVGSSGYAVSLHYLDGEEREEWVRDVPEPFSPEALARRLRGCDAGLVNFVSGEEFDPVVLPRLRREIRGPVLLDLHSATLAREADGRRTRRPSLEGWTRWVGGVDVLQMNRAEAGTLAGCGGGEVTDATIAEVAARAISAGAGAVVVTLGPRGSRLFPDGGGAEEIPAFPPRQVLDPTGCGDVHGAALLAALLGGAALRDAARFAATAAGAQSGIRGWPRVFPDPGELRRRAGLE